jgi:YebC/PmpR family DNA-binding regulatory protein
VAGHSRWHNIRHKKAISDKKRGKAWSKVSRAILAAARQGGSDPAANLALRYAIDEARYVNLPRDTIERLAKKGAGELQGQSFESVRYEGYGPGGVALLVDTLTDNRVRTVSEMRLIFGDHGGSLGGAGCVSYMFESQGEIYVPAGAVSEDRIMDAAVAAGASDVRAPEAGAAGDDAVWTVVTAPSAFHAVRDALEKAGIGVSQAELTMVPSMRVLVTGENAKNLLELVDALEDNDDVQNVYGNFDIPEAELAALEKAGG